DTVAAIISKAKQYWPPSDDVEITAEANPTSAETETLVQFKAAGVNRLSLGVQSFDDEALKTLGREHSSHDAKEAIAMAKELFPAVSFDLIYGRPGQSTEAWAQELEQAFQFKPDHLSLYQLSIEPGTPFHRQNVPAAPENTGADLFELTAALTDAAGLPAYEISNHARPGHECRHNLGIWQGQDYVGIGPGAHGRLGGADNMTDAVYQIHDPARWLDSVTRQGHGTGKRQTLDAPERLQENIMTGLRTTHGIGPEVSQHLNGELLSEMIQGAFLVWESGRLKATASGRLALNGVLARLLSD
ncbi:MAG: coproporphyrinogen-III oxidase family protein, partial [Alphaproteobacteria bacterium]